jgi:hypothetical protein
MIRQEFGEQSMSPTRVFERHAQFRAGWTSIEGDQHRDRPISCTTPDTVAKLQQLARVDRRRTLKTSPMRWELVMGHANRF